MTNTAHRYIVVPAPGCYGDATSVIAAYDTLDEAIRRARRLGSRACVREGEAAWTLDGEPQVGAQKGDRWVRVYEQGSPILFPAPESGYDQ